MSSETETPHFGSRIRGVFEEALQAGKKDLLLASTIGLFLSAVGYVVLGGFVYIVILYMLARHHTGPGTGPELSFSMFFFIYTAIVVLLMFMGMYYSPKENYDFGIRSSRHTIDNPFTYRDDADRAHASLGFLLVIPNFIRLNLVTIKDFITTGGTKLDPDLAGGILVMAKRGSPPGRMLQAYSHFGEKGVAKAIETLKIMRWIRVKGASVSLTNKGVEILRRAGI
jgi:hypothetical protein